MSAPVLPPLPDRLGALMTTLARAMREAGIWKDAYSDDYSFLRREVESLYRGWLGSRPTPPPTRNGRELTRPLRSWDDADAVLMAIIASPVDWVASCACRTEPRVILWLARQFGLWRVSLVAHPTDVRVIDFGAIVVEWPGKDSSLVIDQGDVLDSVGPKTPPLCLDLLATVMLQRRKEAVTCAACDGRGFVLRHEEGVTIYEACKACRKEQS